MAFWALAKGNQKAQAGGLEANPWSLGLAREVEGLRSAPAVGLNLRLFMAFQCISMAFQACCTLSQAWQLAQVPTDRVWLRSRESQAKTHQVGQRRRVLEGPKASSRILSRLLQVQRYWLWEGNEAFLGLNEVFVTLHRLEILRFATDLVKDVQRLQISSQPPTRSPFGPSSRTSQRPAAASKRTVVAIFPFSSGLP